MARNFKELTLQNTCGHYPETDEKKWFNPLDTYCVECEMSCCRNCFETSHKNHKYAKQQYSDDEWKTHKEENDPVMKARYDDKKQEKK